MAAKKFYAVKTGKTTGILDSWDACRASVDGFPGAQYKGFSTRAEAESYLDAAGAVSSGEGADSAERLGRLAADETDVAAKPAGDRLLVYVDGSYQDSLKKYAFGCVFLPPAGEIRLAYGNGDNPESLQHRNVTGEMLGAMYAVRTAMRNGYAEVELCYDYEGIEKWVTGSWRSKTELTQKYAQSMRRWGQEICIFFTKVTAHSNVKYNELADRTAKRGLTEGNGIPKVMLLEELERYEEE
ncbi:MAG: ribonuclease H family protein [Muribaculum sp.]|nr:ribonuclease H family protein [Muribaculum sp.]